MPDVLSDSYARLPLDQIYVERSERQRRELNTENLVSSIRIRGVLNPIIVEREAGPSGLHRLVAGERRLKASQELALPDIPVRFADTLTPIEAQIIELEENIKRSQLSWQDEAKATKRIHELYSELYLGWTQDKTADSISVVKSVVSMYLRVANEIETNAQVRDATTFREAYNIITRRDDRERAAFLDKISHNAPPLEIELEPGAEVKIEVAGIPGAVHVATPVESWDYKVGENPAKNLLLESFLHWAPKYHGPAFNFIHCDFPYGINVFEGPQAGGGRHLSYDDSKEVHFKLLETLLVHFDRIASQSCHVMYWFSMQHYEQIRRMVAELAPDLIIQTHPLIWHKTDGAGIASDPWHGPRHVYETALLMIRGKRKIVQVMSDVYGAPTDRQWHIHTKPEPMLKHFFTMFVDHTTVMLDPTCGSGSSIRAAEALGATSTVGMDIDEAIVAQARTALRHSRALRTASSARLEL